MSSAGTTYAQHAVWFTEQAGVAGRTYHMALGIWFDDGLDRAALQAACAALVARHPMLSRAVADVAGTPTLVPAAVRPAFTLVEVADDAIDGHLTEELARPFDLARGPLARFTLLAGDAGRNLLVFAAHHLVFDGMSKDLLVRDLAAAYGSARANRAAEPPPAAADHDAARHGAADHDAARHGAADSDPAGAGPDWAAAERDRVATELPAAREYWQRRWTGPGEPELPGLIRGPERAESGAAVEFDLPAAVSDGLARTAEALGVTRFELLLAALNILLHRYGNSGLPVGVGLSTRTPATADEIGLHVNELPVHPPEVTGSFGAYAQAVRAGLRELYRFRTVPFAHAVPGQRPAPALTPVSLGYRRRGAEPAFPGTVTSVLWSLFSGEARNALHVQVVDAPTGSTVSLQHSPAAIPTEAVRRIGGHLRTLLAAAVADPDRPVAELPVLTDTEWDQVVRRWTAKPRPYPADATVRTLFDDQVRQRPDAVAVVDDELSITYAELDLASARLAARLERAGVGPGGLVAVGLERSWITLVALLAVLRRGAAYLPVDPAQPAARQALILADAAPALVVTTKTAADGLDPALPTLLLDDFAPPTPHSTMEESGETAGPGGGPNDIAYVLYTSGSTGRPKGVSVPHRALANFLLAMRDELDAGAGDRWLHLTSLSFDISGLEIFLPLITGGRVVIASGVNAADGPAVLRLIRAAQVTHVQATPSGWRVLLAAGLDAPVTALTIGEVLPVPLARELRARVARLVNGYGPTEATIYATLAEIPEEPTEVTIGRPIPNLRTYVLDDALRPVPVGVTGELHLGGIGVAAGYLNRPELTAQRFLPDPFGEPGDLLYRTGDRCRWLPDGQIAFLGRTDGQVKIRGHRVELGEIEARLLEHPDVAGAAVVLRRAAVADAGETEERLVGYVVPRGAAAPDPAELRAHLARTLPAVMVPTAWLVLERLPLNPSGKLDRAALPPPPRPVPIVAAPAPTIGDHPATGGDTGTGAAADPITEQVRTIWQEVLQIPDIGLDEDLFDLGGHSLTITRISGRIQQRLGVEVPLDVFFDTPTIAEIADFVRAALSTGSQQ